MFTRRIFKVAGMAVAAVALGQPAAHAALNLDSGAGVVTYAKETLTTTVTDSSVAYHVLASPTRNRLSFTAPAPVIAAGATAQVRFVLEDLRFAGTDLPTLAIAGKTAATTTLASGGTSGDDRAVITIIAGASEAIAATDTMTATVRSLAVLVDQPGTVRMDTRSGTTGTFAQGTAVSAFRVASGLRENATPVSPAVRLAGGFRTFYGGALVTNVGRISVGPPPGTGLNRLFNAADSDAVALEDMVSETASQVTFSGNREFAEAVFLSENADCSTEDNTDIVSAGAWAAVNLEDANNRYLCIEVDGVTTIPETEAYEAGITYTGISGAAFPPTGANLVLGRVVREGTRVGFPFVNTHDNVNFRFVLTNQGSVDVPYQFMFSPPAYTQTEPLGNAEGTLVANSTVILRAATLVRVTGLRTYTAASLIIGAARGDVDILTIQTNRGDGSTDTVRY